MKHIKVASDAETCMRKLHDSVTDESPIQAEASHLASVEKILDLTRKMDLLKLEISKEIGSIMGYMQGHATLNDASNNVLVKWINSSDKKVVDYDALILEYNIPPDRINAHTSVKKGSRVFTIVAD